MNITKPSREHLVSCSWDNICCGKQILDAVLGLFAHCSKEPPKQSTGHEAKVQTVLAVASKTLHSTLNN